MHRTMLHIVGLIVITLATLGADQPQTQQPRDPFREIMVPPELLLLNQQELGITPEQRDAIRALLEKFQSKIESSDKETRRELASIEELLQKNEFGESDAAARVEKFLEREKENKKLQWSLMLSIRKVLTVEQREKVKKFRDDPTKLKPNFAERFQSKIQKIQDGVQALVDSGVDPSEIGDLMSGFEPLMKEAKFKEAESLLDQALKRIEEKKK
jgi:Spy/CpxP family protein refolding chaperone